MRAATPNSSRNSRVNASHGVSPARILPPGNSHFSGNAPPRRRWQISNRPPRSITAATTQIMPSPPRAPRVALRQSAWDTEIVYSPEVLDHYKNPRNVGDLPDATVKIEVSN